MVQNDNNSAAPRGVFATLSAGFELTTRYLWLMIIPAALDVFLWIGPRLTFGGLIDDLLGRLPAQPGALDPGALLVPLAPFLNQFTYLSVTFLGVPALMVGPSPEKVPVAPMVMEISTWGSWLGTLVALTVAGLLLAALYFTLIGKVLDRSVPSSVELAERSLVPWIGRTFLRLVALAFFLITLIFVILVPISLVAGVTALISQVLATFFILGGFILILSVGIFMGFTPQGMTLNPRSFVPSILESIRLFQRYLSPAVLMLFTVFLIRRLLSWLLLLADTGTWVTAVNILAFAYISTALVVSLFIFYRDRYQLYQEELRLHTQSEHLQ